MMDVVVVFLPGDSNFHTFTELPVTPQAAGFIGTLNHMCFFKYHSVHYGLFLDIKDAILLFLQRLPFLVYRDGKWVLRLCICAER